MHIYHIYHSGGFQVFIIFIRERVKTWSVMFSPLPDLRIFFTQLLPCALCPEVCTLKYRPEHGCGASNNVNGGNRIIEW